VVVLPKAAAANEPFKLKFAIEGDFLFHPDGSTYWMLPVGPWFPMPGLNGQYYTVHSTIRQEKPYIAIAPGKTLSRTEDGDYNVVVNEIDKPVQFLCAVGGKFGVQEETADGLTIRVASYGMRNKRAEKTHLNLARKLIKYYEPWLGPFPFEEFNIIEINELGWGQAPPGTMFITREAFTPFLAQIWSHGVNHRFAHEIAHQYWGHVVKMGNHDEQWITESFAEYSSLFAVRKLRGDDAVEKIKENWKSNAELSTGKSSIINSHRLLGNGMKSWYDRRNLVYFKGAVVLQALHEEIGDKYFVSFLRNYQMGLEWRFGTTRDMITLLKKLTGEDFTQYFEDCVWGTEMPPKKIIKKTAG
jgi:aminopeptidase N